MGRYNIAQIVALTGIKAPTLRKWETRYDLFEPNRTDTNIRYYTDNQLKKLINISVLLRNGYKISKIDKMSDEDIYDNVASTLLESKYEDEISALIICTLEMDEIKFDHIIKSQIIKRGLLATTTKILYPFLNQVGVLWGINKVIPAQEHFISSLIKQKIFSSIDLLPLPHKNAPSILMFLPEGEHHEIGLLLAYYIAKELGWRVFYLGQNVPIQNIKQVTEEIHPDLMLTMFIASTQQDFTTQISKILNENNLPLLASGNAAFFEHINNKKLIYLSNPEDLVNQLNAFELKITKPFV